MLAEVLTRVMVTVVVMIVIAIPTIVGVGRFRRSFQRWQATVRAVFPIALVLVPVLLVNRVTRQELIDISQDYGLRMDSFFYDLEGGSILLLQQIASTPLTQYFTFIYIYAYAFMLIFPVIAYFTLRDSTTLRRLLAAYTLNYAIGATFYVLIHAFGPRQYYGPELEGLIYDFQPAYQHLTREVNHNTNVFPSLHTSLSATVMIFAYRTREAFPRWTPIATLIAVSVWISTMYLGIHWAIDVFAGLVLAAVCVRLADRLVGRWDVATWFEPMYDRLASARDWLVSRADRHRSPDPDR